MICGLKSEQSRNSDLAIPQFQNHTFSNMPSNNGEVFELVQAIGDLVPNLPYAGCSLTSAKRAELVSHAERLAFAAREPAENLYLQSTQV